MPNKVSLRFDGLSDLMDALKLLPEELASEGGQIVTDNAIRASEKMRAKYPERTYGRKTGRGNLRAGVGVQITDGGRYGVRAVVYNKARHAWFYEYGTEVRHSNTHPKGLGRMKPGNVFVPIMIEHRRKMQDELADLLVRHHLQVTRAA